jgi:hypothetical protein
MVSRPRGRRRHRVVALIAVFTAFGGTAYAAKPLITGAKSRTALVGPRFIAWRESMRG